MRLIDNLFSVSEQSTCGITPQAMTPQATLAVKCTEALKMKIKKYCKFFLFKTVGHIFDNYMEKLFRVKRKDKMCQAKEG